MSVLPPKVDAERETGGVKTKENRKGHYNKNCADRVQEQLRKTHDLSADVRQCTSS